MTNEAIQRLIDRAETITQEALDLTRELAMLRSSVEVEPEAPEEPETDNPFLRRFQEKKPEERKPKRAARVVWEPKAAPEVPEPEEAEQKAGYTGFLLIRCEYCGTLRGFNAKGRTAETTCRSCRASVPLAGLVPLYLDCGKCGKSFKYMTNCTGQKVTYSCLNCGARVELERSRSGNAYKPTRNDGTI